MTKENETLTRPDQHSTASPTEVAVEWLALLQSGAASEQDIEVFKTWLSRYPSNFAAFRKIAQSWEDVGLAAMASELKREGVKSSSSPTLAEDVAGLRVSRRRLLSAGVAACLALALGIGVWTNRPEPVTEFQYATKVGEIRVVSLEDGSTITLGASTSVEGRFSKRNREVELNRGRAFFDVAPDSRRPFQVAVAKSEIVVVGTAFDVEYGLDAVQVSVERGRVEVVPRDSSSAGRGTSLAAGLQLRSSLSGSNGAATRFDTGSLSWRSGQLAYVDARLSDVIAEVNRYRSKKIRIADREIENLRVSFSVASDHTDVLLAGLEATLPIRVVHADGVSTLYLDTSK